MIVPFLSEDGCHFPLKGIFLSCQRIFHALSEDVNLSWQRTFLCHVEDIFMSYRMMSAFPFRV